eukprot:GILI01006146.1.p1 GENE.GILI01006146.1~~GILI01006146.1.p1  ORF type:complete len:396 (-),score=82.84 GILI01006146.1:171-1358(-)
MASDDERHEHSRETETSTLLKRSALSGSLKSKYIEPVAYVMEFPGWLEHILSPFDDHLIGVCQYFHPSRGGARGTVGKIVKYFNLFITALTAIEVGLMLPLLTYTLGYDAVASWSTIVIFMTAFISQVPKRFLHRTRPYLCNPPRALMSRADKTSSFPSRAVTCAFVYSFILIMALHYPQPLSLNSFTWRDVLIIMGAVAVSSFARINLGVHYPSDCVAGLVQGLVICLCSLLFYHLELIDCLPCYANECYTSPASSFAFTSQQFDASVFNWVGVVVASVACLVLTAVSLMPPLSFWNKCAHFYGLLAPCFVFQLGFLCPTAAHKYGSLPPPAAPSTMTFFAAFLAAGVFTGLGVAVRTRKHLLHQIIGFGGLFVLGLLWLVNIRLSHAFKDTSA